MNRTKIEWTDWTWNPITGCEGLCSYCYARKLFNRFHKSFEPMFHVERMNEIDRLKKPCKVFVCSVSDLFAYWTINEWREAVLNKIWKGYEHIQFQLLTKEPQNIISYRGVRKPIFDYDYPKNFWIGCTVTDNSQIWKIEEIKKIKCGVRFVSFEPLLEDLPVLDLSGIDWVIIGALTGSEKFPIKQEWVDNIYQRASRYGIPVFIKDNVKKSLGCDGVLKQFPK